MADQATAVSTRLTSDIGQFQAMLETRARDIQMALPSHISPDKFQRTVLTAIAQNQDLLKADRNSLVLSVYRAAQDGLLPDGREAALVIFNTRQKIGGEFKSVKQVQYMPMVYGLRKKILQSGEVVSLEVGVVYRKEVDAGHFYYEVGKFPPLGHRPMLDLTMEEAADENILGAYSIATMKDGTKSYEFMRRFEIDLVRQVSQTGATGRTVKFGNDKGKPIEPKGPWVDWFPEMAKKTVMRRHAKTLPQSGDVLIDVEGRAYESGASTALALGGTEPDEPTLITDDSGDTIDPATGEVVEEAGNTGQGVTSEDEGATAEQTGDSTDEQTGVTKDPAEAKADAVIDAMDKATLLPDLKAIYKDVEPHLGFMDVQLSRAIEEAFDRNEKRLKPAPAAKAKAEAEPESAK